MSQPYEMVVGLEVHVQLKTRTKAFCGCSADFGAPPNVNTCPVCLALPGALPVLNGHAVELATRPGVPYGDGAFAVFEKCWDKGVFVRPVGDSLAFCPPLIAEKKHLDLMFGVVAEMIRSTPPS